MAPRRPAPALPALLVALPALLLLLQLPSHGDAQTDDADRWDQCYNAAKLANTGDTDICPGFGSSDCDNNLDYILFDARHSGLLAGQCRFLCLHNVPCDVGHEIITTSCTLCTNRSHILPYVVRNAVGLDEDICVPRHVCIEHCGPEPEGCVYSGTCASQICLNGRHTGNAASISRYTHAGPGILLSVDGKATEAFPLTTPPHIRLGIDHCGPGFNVALSVPVNQSTSSCLSAFSDTKTTKLDNNSSNSPASPSNTSTITATQCRAHCAAFDRSPYELERVATHCGKCANQTFLQPFISKTPSSAPHICVPVEVCERECGVVAPPGCLYTGSCQSMLCLWGIDSKKPAMFSEIDDSSGTPAFVTVDDSINTDEPPPVFVHTLSPSPCPTPEPSGYRDSLSPSPPPPSNSPSTTPIETVPPPICIASHHLSHPHSPPGVFKKDVRTTVLCDVLGSCATTGHMVVWQGEPMSMRTYCREKARNGCVRRVMWVNSPKYARGLRVKSSTTDLQFTALAARLDTRAEERVLSIAISWIGL